MNERKHQWNLKQQLINRKRKATVGFEPGTWDENGRHDKRWVTDHAGVLSQIFGTEQLVLLSLQQLLSNILENNKYYDQWWVL